MDRVVGDGLGFSMDGTVCAHGKRLLRMEGMRATRQCKVQCSLW